METNPATIMVDCQHYIRLCMAVAQLIHENNELRGTVVSAPDLPLREWHRAEYVPDGIRFTPKRAEDDGSWVRDAKGNYAFYYGDGSLGSSDWWTPEGGGRQNLRINSYAPFVEYRS